MKHKQESNQEQQDNKQQHVEALASGISKLTLNERKAIRKEILRGAWLNQETQIDDGNSGKSGTAGKSTTKRDAAGHHINVGDTVRILNPGNEPNEGTVTRIGKYISVRPRNHRIIVRKARNLLLTQSKQDE